MNDTITVPMSTHKHRVTYKEDRSWTHLIHKVKQRRMRTIYQYTCPEALPADAHINITGITRKDPQLTQGPICFINNFSLGAQGLNLTPTKQT